MNVLCTPRFRARLVQALAVANILASTFWTIGQIARDATWATGLCFYLPSAGIAAQLLLSGVAATLLGSRRQAMVWIGLSLVPIAVVMLVENDLSSKPAGPVATHRVVHWNTGGRPGRPPVTVEMLPLKAGLYAFTDVPSKGSLEEFRLQLAESNQYQSQFYEGLAVVARGNLTARGWVACRDGFKIQQVDWKYADRTLSLLLVDLPSSIWVARDPLLRELNQRIAEIQPDLVFGDFNAPRRSRALCDLPIGYRHAYHSVGGGWGYTWPIPIPVFSLDHCLHGRRVQPSGYWLGGMSRNNDHRFQVFDFAVDVEK